MARISIRGLYNWDDHLFDGMVLPEELDQEVASIKLKAMGFGVDTLSEEQWKYLHQA